MGHSAVAYDAAKERLERKFGGKRRQSAIYLDELERFQQIQLGNARDLEHLFVWFLTTHQPLRVISVRRYLTEHDEDGKSKDL